MIERDGEGWCVKPHHSATILTIDPPSPLPRLRVMTPTSGGTRAPRVIRLNGIGLRYGRGSEVLHDVTFHLRPGSFHFLTGPSGSGKTSLLRMLFMSIQPTRGAIHVLGQDIS